MEPLQEQAHKQLARLETALGNALTTGEVEAVHDLRVASRRLGQILDVLAPSLDRGIVRRAQQTLRRLRRAFRNVRDLDVLLISLCEARPDEQMEAQELAQLEGILTHHREIELDSARRRCKRHKTTQRLGRIAELCSDLLALDPTEFPRLCHSARTRLHKRIESLMARDPRRDESCNLHENRLRLKKVRYAAEIVERLEGGLPGSALEQMKSMQDLLGQWHDHLSAADRVGRIAGRRKLLYGQTRLAGRLLGYAAHRAQAGQEDHRQILACWGDLASMLHELSSAIPGGPDIQTGEAHDADRTTQASGPHP